MSIKRRLRLQLIGACLLIAGLLGAVAIYATASDAPGDAVGYEFVDGVAYPILTYESKAYRNDLERFGGKAAVMADDFNRWLSGVFTAKHLACALAVLAGAIALACFRAAGRAPPDDAER